MNSMIQSRISQTIALTAERVGKTPPLNAFPRPLTAIVRQGGIPTFLADEEEKADGTPLRSSSPAPMLVRSW